MRQNAKMGRVRRFDIGGFLLTPFFFLGKVPDPFLPTPFSHALNRARGKGVRGRRIEKVPAPFSPQAGNVTNDGNYSYQWDAESHLAGGLPERERGFIKYL